MLVADNYLDLIAIPAYSSLWPINEEGVLPESDRLEENQYGARERALPLKATGFRKRA